MILKPISMLVKKVGGVDFVAGSEPFFATAATIDATTPVGVQNGDHILAFVFHRHTTVTPPSGWTLLHKSDSVSISSFVQWLSCYKKDIVLTTDADTSYTWGQGDSLRIGVAYVVARGGVVEEIVSNIRSAISEKNVEITPTSLTATADDELFLMAATSIYAALDGSQPTPPPGTTLTTGEVLADYRLAVARQNRNTGQQNSGVFRMHVQSTSSAIRLIAITLRIKP
jgi:hypothetical protein